MGAATGCVPIARVLAGKHTDVAITFSVSIAISLALGGGYVSLVRKLKAQSRELVRLRVRCEEFEKATSRATGPTLGGP